MTSPEKFERPLLLRMRPSTFAAVQAVAARDARSLNRMVDQLLVEALDARAHTMNRRIRKLKGGTVADVIAEREGKNR